MGSPKLEALAEEIRRRGGRRYFVTVEHGTYQAPPYSPPGMRLITRTFKRHPAYILTVYERTTKSATGLREVFKHNTGDRYHALKRVEKWIEENLPTRGVAAGRESRRTCPGRPARKRASRPGRPRRAR